MKRVVRKPREIEVNFVSPNVKVVRKKRGQVAGGPVVLGIDPSLTGCGITVYRPEAADYLALLLKPTRFGVYRLHDLGNAIEALVRTLPVIGSPIQYIVMEGYSRASVNQREEMGEASAVIRLSLARGMTFARPAFPDFVAPNQLKKFVTGSGAGKKDDIKLHVFKKWGEEFRDHNMADAYGLARIAGALWLGKTDYQYEDDVLQKVRGNSEFDPFFGVPSVPGESQDLEHSWSKQPTPTP